jgi:hypothetical protein
MNLFRKPLILLAFAALAIPSKSMGQYLFQVEPFFNYFGYAGRYELCGNYVMPTATFEGVVPVYGGQTWRGDSTAKRSLTNAMGYGGSIGLSIPIKATGHISCWAAHVELMGNMYSWQDVNQRMGADGTYTASPNALTASTIQVGLPIGLEWKAGNDAILTKRLGFGTSLGVGLIPQVNMTSLDNAGSIDSHLAFGCTPYAKVEGAFWVGMCVKLRAMYNMGDITLIDVNKPIPTLTDGPFKITSNSNITLSLILMIFSPGWDETDWWNTHDTYNQHDRLN